MVGVYITMTLKKAFDEFAKRKGVEILCLPTAQGLIFKK